MDLKQFCHKGEGRDDLSLPFSDGDYTYATNGHIAIRVPRRVDVPEIDGSPNIGAVFSTEQLEPPRAIDLDILPKASHKPCRSCDGYGYGELCIECNGNGDHACDCDHCDETCDQCSGSGMVRIFNTTDPLVRTNCNFCDGTGEFDDRRSASLNSRQFMIKYLDLIRKLTGPATVRLGKKSTDRHEFNGPGWTVIIIGVASFGTPASIDINWPQEAEIA